MEIVESNGDYQVELLDDESYNLNSTDNLTIYDKVYSSSLSYHTTVLSRYEIRVLKERKLLKTALIIEGLGATSIHPTGYIIELDRIVICCSDYVYCISLPDLNLIWRKKTDEITCFEILKYHNDYIIHGEIDITRIDNNGNITWQTSGVDIFVTLDSSDKFEIVDDKVIATDWNNWRYLIDIDTGESEVEKP